MEFYRAEALQERPRPFSLKKRDTTGVESRASSPHAKGDSSSSESRFTNTGHNRIPMTHAASQTHCPHCNV
jgi:hypothetical protein